MEHSRLAKSGRTDGELLGPRIDSTIIIIIIIIIIILKIRIHICIRVCMWTCIYVYIRYVHIDWLGHGSWPVLLLPQLGELYQDTLRLASIPYCSFLNDDRHNFEIYLRSFQKSRGPQSVLEPYLWTPSLEVCDTLALLETWD